MLFSGGIYPLLITLLFLGVYTLLLLLFREHSLRQLVVALGGTVGFMVGFAAIKLLPMLDFLALHPRTMYDYSGFSFSSMIYSLFARDQTKEAIANLAIEARGFWAGVTGGMAENGMYIGWLPLILAIVGVGLHHKQRFLLLLTGLIFLWLSFGNRVRVEMWTLLHLLPGYNSMRIAQRFRLVVGLLAALLAGFGFETVQRFAVQQTPMRYRRLAGRVSLLIPAIILVDLLSVSQPIFNQTFIIPPFELPRSPVFKQVRGYPSYNQAGWITEHPKETVDYSQPLSAEQLFTLYTHPLILHGSQGAMYPALKANLGTIDGYEPIDVPRYAIPSDSPDYRGELFLAEGNGQVELTTWSPNRIVASVAVDSPDQLVLNQNHYPGWRTTDGRAVQNVEGLLAVPVTENDRQIELYYQPFSFVLGSLVTGLTLILAAAIYVPFLKR